MPYELDSHETDANWRHIIAISTIAFAFLIVGSAFFLHYREHDRSPQYSTHIMQQAPAMAAAVPTSDPDVVSASMSQEDDIEYNNKDTIVHKDSDNKYNHAGEEEIEQDVVVVDEKTTTKLANAKAYLEFDSDSNSAEASECETSYSSTLRRLEQQQQELEHCYAAMNRSKADLLEASLQTKQQLQTSPSSSSSSSSSSTAPLVSEYCLQCLCETATECRSVNCGVGGVACGIFRISFNYWIDAGRPRLQGVNDKANRTESDVFMQCVSNSFCAARAVEANMKKYAKDCNKDGKIDCWDFAMLHILGPTGCVRDEMPPVFTMRLSKCLAKFN